MYHQLSTPTHPTPPPPTYPPTHPCKPPTHSRFAQRVACVANVVRVNEATDPLLLIAQLRQENRDLRAQLALLRSGATWGGGTWGGAPPHPHRHTPSLGGVTGGREQGGMQGEGDLDEHSQVLGEDEEEKDVVQGKLWVERAVEGYLRDASPSAALDLGGNIHHITAGSGEIGGMWVCGGGCGCVDATGCIQGVGSCKGAGKYMSRCRHAFIVQGAALNTTSKHNLLTPRFCTPQAAHCGEWHPVRHGGPAGTAC